MAEKPETPKAKKGKKKWVIIGAIAVVLIVAAAMGGGDTSEDTGDTNLPADFSSEEDASSPDSGSAALVGSDQDVGPSGGEDAGTSDGEREHGTYTLPCGASVHFLGEVRNDVTGKWRISTTSDSIAPVDFALEYYEAIFSADDEIHAIWNATLGTTTAISVSPDLGCLFVDTHEYVPGEEHDAKILFSGDVLESVLIDIETGEVTELE